MFYHKRYNNTKHNYLQNQVNNLKTIITTFLLLSNRPLLRKFWIISIIRLLRGFLCVKYFMILFVNCFTIHVWDKCFPQLWIVLFLKFRYHYFGSIVIYIKCKIILRLCINLLNLFKSIINSIFKFMPCFWKLRHLIRTWYSDN